MHPGEATTRTTVPLPAAEPPAPRAEPLRTEPQNPDAEPRRDQVIRWAVWATLAAVIALAALRLYFVQGLFRRVTIDGPSMAPALLGPHYDVTCADCGFRFACDADQPPEGGRAVCSNCGYAENGLLPIDQRPAQRVLIDRWPLLWRWPSRGAVVACALPATGDIAVKRVSGLPGERLSIQDGDLYANGQIVRKTPAELRSVRVLVHDNDYQPQITPDLPPRWQGAAQGTRWRPSGSGFALPAGDTQVIDTLAYQHWPCTGNPLVPRTQATAIRDLDAFNQGTSSRELVPVHDVHLTCRLHARGEGTLALFADDRGRRLIVTIDSASSRLRVTSGDQTLAEQPLPANLLARPIALLFGLCDQQLLLSINNRQILRVPYAPAAEPPAAAVSRAPLEIGASGLAVEVTRLQVWRDIHYLAPTKTSDPWQLAKTLSPAEFALLGDNPPVSIDSRDPKFSILPASALLGRVDRPFWAQR